MPVFKQIRQKENVRCQC